MSGRLRAEPGWRWAQSGLASRFLCSSVCFSSLGPRSSLLPVLVGVGVDWNIIQHPAIGVFSQSEPMAAACTLLTAAVKILSQWAAR